MIKQILTTLIVLFCFKQVEAQNIGFKLVGGANFCQVDGDQMSGFNKLGFRFGIGSFINTDKEDELGFELTYTQKGSRTANDPDNPPPFIVRYNYNYIEAPIYYQKKLKDFGLKFAIAPAYYISARADQGGGFVDDPGLRKFELSGIVGPSYNINDQWSFYMHYQYSLMSIIDLNKSQVPGAAWRRTGVYNHLISAGLNLKFK
ncbi:PorT family protein [Bacteroidia bacterium]|nr:PorT family protein [Bacteroidia bacterium]